VAEVEPPLAGNLQRLSHPAQPPRRVCRENQRPILARCCTLPAAITRTRAALSTGGKRIELGAQLV
jgi:hypothetical protein